MGMTFFRTASAAALAASISMAASPAFAADLPQAQASTGYGPAKAYDGEADNAADYGYGRYGRHHRRDRGVSAGEVISGVAVLGAIVAIATSASNNNRNRDRARYNEPQRRSVRDRGYQSGGIDSAVDMCVDQIERGNDRVGSVDNAARDSSGWRVTGSLESGSGFTCQIDNDGRIRNVDLGGYSGSGYQGADYDGSGYQTEDNQYADDVYARARAGQGDAAPTEYDYDAAGSTDQQPAYPGGPLPGEDGYESARYTR